MTFGVWGLWGEEDLGDGGQMDKRIRWYDKLEIRDTFSFSFFFFFSFFFIGRGFVGG